MSVQQLTPPQVRYVNRWMLLQLPDSLIYRLLGRAELCRHHGVAGDEDAVLVVVRVHQRHQLRHAQDLHRLVYVLGVRDEPHHLCFLLVVYLRRHNAGKQILLKAFYKAAVRRIILLLIGLLALPRRRLAAVVRRRGPHRR